MSQGFLERESGQARKKNRKLFLGLLAVYVCIVSVLVFVLKDAIDLSDYRSQKLVVCLVIFSVLMLVFVLVGLITSMQSGANGKNLLLPFQENTKKAVGEIIDREVQEGKVQVDEYMEKFSEGEKPRGERVLLLPSYLLLINSMGRVMAIPRDRIYWICAQVGIKGRSSYRVRLAVFTEKKMFCHLIGVDIPHVEGIAEKLYQYLPNVFRDYDTFTLSHELEKLFNENREEFLKFYESEKRKQAGGMKRESGQ